MQFERYPVMHKVIVEHSHERFGAKFYVRVLSDDKVDCFLHLVLHSCKIDGLWYFRYIYQSASVCTLIIVFQSEVIELVIVTSDHHCKNQL